jgi:hypothetical protein
MNQDLVLVSQVVLEFRHYYRVGPAVQAQGLGWSLGTWGGEAVGAYTTVLSADINQQLLQAITLNDASQLPSSGTNFILDRDRRNIIHRYIDKHINRCYERRKKHDSSITHIRSYSYKYI